MGGAAVRHEPGSVSLLQLFPEVYQIFQQAGWTVYFERLGEFDQGQVLEFAQNLQDDFSMVQGARISVTEEDIVQVSGLPATGTRWFSRKKVIMNAQQEFLRPEEQVERRGRGVSLHSLPQPWPSVAEFIKHYLTCEGRYQVVYNHDFVLMNHLRNAQLVNIPYYLLGCIKNMSYYCKRSKFPLLSLTHHRLCQLLIQRGLAQQNPPLHAPLPDPQPSQTPHLSETPQQSQTPLQPESSHHTSETPHEGQQDNTPYPPVDPTAESPRLAESAGPTISVPSDDPLTPPSPPIRKRKRTLTGSVSRPHTRARSQALTRPESPSPRKKPGPSKKRRNRDFTAFLPKRKKRTTVETESTPVSPDPATILLKPLPPSQIPQPVSPGGTTTQELVPRDNMTSFMAEKVTVPQEPVTSPVAETQEPATEVQNYTKHDDRGKSVVVETQEPTTPVHQQTTPAESAGVQGIQTMTSLLEENEFLKSELEAYKKELTMAREAFERELNLYTLAHAASMQNKEPCKEYMCQECGNIYQGAGYKVIEVQLSEVSKSVEIKEECPTAPQEPVGPSIKQEKHTESQIVYPSQADPATQTESPPQSVSVAIQTETPPQSVDKASQTMPQPITVDAKTQTMPWNQLEQMNKWKRQYAEEQDKVLGQHKLQWQNHAYANWDRWEQMRQQLRNYKKEARESKEKITLMFSLAQKLMATRKPSVNYSLFLAERFIYFQLKAIKNGRPYELMTAGNFVETFNEAPESDQHLLCELYLHNEAMPENREVNIIPITGDIQIRAFVSFLSNQLTWQSAFTASSHNEDNKLLWIRPEPLKPTLFIAQYYEFLQKPGMHRYMQQLQASILSKCQQHIRVKGNAAMNANVMFWQQSCKERQDYHPFNPHNLQAALSRVSNYIRCIQHCGVNWIGYRFHFPSLWLPSEQYQCNFQLTNRDETLAWQHLQNNKGFRAPTDDTFSSYCLSNLHAQSQYSDSDSD